MSRDGKRVFGNEPAPYMRFKGLRLTILGSILTLMSSMLCGCPHINSGLPPPLRMPYLQETSPAEGIYHRVKAGETLQDLASIYGVDSQYLMEINNVESPDSIRAGVQIFVPKSLGAGPEPQAKASTAPKPPTEGRTDEMMWPVKGTVVSGFGVSGGVQRNGIAIEASAGAPVLAARDGTVGHVGIIPGYGNVILIEHSDRLVTVYAHLNEVKVRQGDKVKRGAVIGALGSLGSAEKPRLYFEVRSKSKPRNPLFFLTKTVPKGLT